MKSLITLENMKADMFLTTREELELKMLRVRFAQLEARLLEVEAEKAQLAAELADLKRNTEAVCPTKTRYN